MSGAQLLSGLTLRGQRSGSSWIVGDAIAFAPGHSKGVFSVGYKAKNQDGLEAFLKASDLSLVGQSDDPLKALHNATTAYQFERSVLEHCNGSRLDKIVTALDFGSHPIIVEGVQDIVFYIVFELASGDLRKFVDQRVAMDLIWNMSAMHNFTVAMSQLHGVGVYHNDLKPANALVFDDTHKVADLGRATSPNFPVAHELALCAGDNRFAPPEQLYFVDNPTRSIDKFVRAKAGDLYNLGSIIHFLVTKRMLTPEIILRMTDPLKPRSAKGGCCDSYDSALPYWRKAFDDVMMEFTDDIDAAQLDKYQFAFSELNKIVLHLCEPRYEFRGDLDETPVALNKYSLQKITSRLDNLRSRVLVKSRAQ